MSQPFTYSVRINRGPEQTITCRNGGYQEAVVAAVAMLEFSGDEAEPVLVEIWIPALQPDYPPSFYCVDRENNSLIVRSVGNPKREQAVRHFKALEAAGHPIPLMVWHFPHAA